MKKGDTVLLEDILPRDPLSRYKDDLCNQLYIVLETGEFVTKLHPLFFKPSFPGNIPGRVIFYTNCIVCIICIVGVASEVGS